MASYNGYTISYDGKSVVTIYKNKVSADDYDNAVYEACNLRSKFDRSKAGSDWGNDGVGYACNLKHGIIDMKRSGVGPRKFAQCLKNLTTPPAPIMPVIPMMTFGAVLSNLSR